MISIHKKLNLVENGKLSFTEENYFLGKIKYNKGELNQ